jgi:hypothetical protein
MLQLCLQQQNTAVGTCGYPAAEWAAVEVAGPSATTTDQDTVHVANLLACRNLVHTVKNCLTFLLVACKSGAHCRLSCPLCALVVT